MNPSGTGGPLYTPRTRRHIMENFSPAGLHVLVVDDDPLCLMVLERMLKQCEYEVTTCNEVRCALEILRDKSNEVDVVISDVYMPDEDGFRLLEVVGLELDLPVIMISANADVNVVMKGVLHGACDYLIKPVRIEELRNIWQHVIRRKGKDYGRTDFQGEISTDPPASDSREEVFRKRKDAVEIPDVDVEEISSQKKPRVNWSPQLHQQFVNAVNELGVDKAVPKKILEIMNVQGLSRENVASHLQKYRLYLKRLSGVIPEPFPVASFQASGDGSLGGSMLVRPGRKGSEPIASIKGLNLGAGLVSKSGKGQSLDTGTMKSLSQFKSFQQRQAANRAQVLSAIGVGSSSHVPSSSEGGLVRMVSLDLSYLPAVAQDVSAGGPSSKIMHDLARVDINRSIKLEDDLVLPAPAIEGIMRTQSSVEVLIAHSSSSASSDKNQGSRVCSPINVTGSVTVQGLVEEAMKCQSDRIQMRINQESNVAYGLASQLFGSSDVSARQVDVSWSSSHKASELNYDQNKLQLIQDASTEVGVLADEAFDNSDMSTKQKPELSAGSAATEMSGETFSDCSFDALIEDLGIVPKSQQQTAAQQTNSETLNVDEYLQLD